MTLHGFRDKDTTVRLRDFSDKYLHLAQPVSKRDTARLLQAAEGLGQFQRQTLSLIPRS